jgi:hypothetical protein
MDGHSNKLRAVNKPPARARARRAPAHPPAKMYHVDRQGFRELVQRLTGMQPPATASHDKQVGVQPPVSVRDAAAASEDKQVGEQPQVPVRDAAAAASEDKQQLDAPSCSSSQMDAQHGKGGALNK